MVIISFYTAPDFKWMLGNWIPTKVTQPKLDTSI